MTEVEKLQKLLGEVLNELCSRFTAHSEDYLESLRERARELGVNV